jgi:hypothetical protein
LLNLGLQILGYCIGIAKPDEHFILVFVVNFEDVKKPSRNVNANFSLIAVMLRYEASY